MTTRRLILSLLGLTLAVLAFPASSAFARRAYAYCQACSFGSEGSGEGQFSSPAGVALSEVGASTGDIYVVDKGNNRVERFNSAGTFLSQFDGSAAPTGIFAGPEAIAVDNSTNPLDLSAGDVYVTDVGHKVIDKFTAEGTYLGQITAGEGAAAFGELLGVAVDPEGVVWVYQGSGEIDSFSSAEGSGFITSRTSQAGGTPNPGIAVDREDHLYVVSHARRTVEELGSDGKIVREEVGGREETTAIAVDPATGQLYVVAPGPRAVGVFSTGGALVEGFGSENLSEGDGIAVSSSTATVYVADRATAAVKVFPFVVFPDVAMGEASNLQSEGAATLNGTVNPAGVPVTSCKFEYGTSTSYGETAPCATGPGSGNVPVPVTANLTGLAPDSVYHYRIVAGNANGESTGPDETFIASKRPVVSAESYFGVGSTVATFKAQVNSGGLPTTYRVDYGPTTAYGASTQDAVLPASAESSQVEVALKGLLPATEYHLRLVATNSINAATGEDLSFKTYPLFEAGLPDGRRYEAVSPVATEGNANVYVPSPGVPYFTRFGEHGVYTGHPFAAADSGGAVVYSGDPPPTGPSTGGSGAGSGEQYMATRAPAGGWTVADIQPPGHQGAAEYRDFSNDLYVGILESPSPLTTTPYGGLYSRSASGGGYGQIYSGAGSRPQYIGANAGTGDVAAMSHVLLASSRALLEGVGPLEKELEEAVNKAAEEGAPGRALYESVGGKLSLVSVLPDGKVDANASFGSVANGEQDESSTDNVVSADGSRIFWTDEGTGDLYETENGESSAPTTAQVDAAVGGGGAFRAASADGSKALFIKGNLYEYDLNSGATTDLTPGVEVLGLAGTSKDLGYIYYVDSTYKLNLWHEGNTVFIAQLSPNDGYNVVPFDGGGEYSASGDWDSARELRTTAVTGDGHSLIFMSAQSLTSYDNEEKGERLEEIFLYDTNTGHLTCVSCNSSGEPPVPTEFDNSAKYAPLGAFLPITRKRGLYQQRVISEDGSRVFFDSAEPLSPQDTNGWLDVYEWERAGVGTCREVGGCVYLLSGGTNPESSYLIGASASGDDVFIISRAQLLAQDRNDNDDVYDVRVGGVQPPPSSACTGSGCQGVAPAPPVFATPSSVTFNGVGNFPPASGQGRPTVKSLTQRQKLTRALKICHGRRNRHKRAVCEVRARKLYGAKSHAIGNKRSGK